MDFLYGKLNKLVEKLYYSGVTNDDLRVIVKNDASNPTIEVQVLNNAKFLQGLQDEIDSKITASEFNIENGVGDYSLIQKELSGKQGQATGHGSVVFGGFRGDKPNDSPNPIPNDDAIVNGLEQDEYNDTISKVTGIQSAIFGAGNRAYGDWNFIVGKDNKTTSRGSFVFGGKNYVGDPSNPNKYLWSMAVGGLNIIGSDYSFAAGSKNHLSGSYSIGLGYDNTLRCTSAKALGNGNLIDNSGYYSIAIGNGLSIYHPLQIALGNYNTPVDSNILLVLGSGNSDNDRSNAFEVTKTGVARAYGTPVGDNDLIRKVDLDARVSANPTETGTIDLTKLKIGNIIYNIPSGGGGGGAQLYKHVITATLKDASSTVNATIVYLSSSSDIVTDIDGLMALSNNGILCNETNVLMVGDYTSIYLIHLGFQQEFDNIYSYNFIGIKNNVSDTQATVINILYLDTNVSTITDIVTQL